LTARRSDSYSSSIRLAKPFSLCEIVSEPEGGAHRDYDSVAENLGSALRGNLQHISKTPIDELVEKRYEKFRRLGIFTQGKTTIASAPS